MEQWFRVSAACFCLNLCPGVGLSCLFDASEVFMISVKVVAIFQVFHWDLL